MTVWKKDPSIWESERDSSRFHWVEATNNDKIEIYHFSRFTFAIRGNFGCSFGNFEQKFGEVVEKVRDDMYVDDLVTGGECKNEVKKLKSDSITLFW